MPCASLHGRLRVLPILRSTMTLAASTSMVSGLVGGGPRRRISPIRAMAHPPHHGLGIALPLRAPPVPGPSSTARSELRVFRLKPMRRGTTRSTAILAPTLWVWTVRRARLRVQRPAWRALNDSVSRSTASPKVGPDVLCHVEHFARGSHTVTVALQHQRRNQGSKTSRLVGVGR